MDIRQRTTRGRRLLSRGGGCTGVALLVVLCWGGAARGDGFAHMAENDIDCLDCHNIHDGDLIPTGLDLLLACQSCHNPLGRAAAKSNIGLHVTRAGTIDCGKCHDPHLPTDPNADHIRARVRYPTASTLVDYPDIDPRKFVNGEAPYDGICEVCHTATLYHRNNDGGDHGHNVDVTCSTCHPHSAGFVPSCSDCHDSPQDNGDGVPPGGRRAVVSDGSNPADFGNVSHHVLGNVQDSDCLVCHYMGTHQAGTVKLRDADQGELLIYEFQDGNPAGLESFCLSCHDADGALAGGGVQPFSDGITAPDIKAGTCWEDSAHGRVGYWRNAGSPLTCFGDGEATGCHSNGHGSDNVKLLNAAAGVALDRFCYNCHTQGMISNDALSGPELADDIEQAFGLAEVHDLGTTFTFEGRSYELQCTTCHNPHVVTGKHWGVDQGMSPISRPDLTADPVMNPRAMGRDLFGAVAGEKMADFAARGSGTGGWYYNVARGYPAGSTGMAADQVGVYQPPRTGDGYNFEFSGEVLPDYPSFCLDCHSYKMSEAVYPVNWGQGIPPNYDGDPTTWVAPLAPHGLSSANVPYFTTDPGMWGNNGNPDPIFLQDGVTRGRGYGHFMRWPYESAARNAGINFVLSCTDCHETHGSWIGSMLRTEPNNGSGSTIWNTMCNNCHYYYGGQHAGMSCGYASCHEQNSIHRIKKNGGNSGGIYLWGPPTRPSTTPEIERVIGAVGSEELTVIFTDSVWSNADMTGGLTPADFLLTDVNDDNPRAIVLVEHVPGSAVATLTMSAPLIPADFRTDLLATRGISAWDAGGEPAGPWPVLIPTCLDGEVRFQFGEPAGSPTVQDDERFYTGTVNDPSEALLGDGLLHGDGVNNYVLFQDDPKCFKVDTAMTLEFRVHPFEIASGTDTTIQRVFARDDVDCYQASLWRRLTGEWEGRYSPPDGVASFALWVSPEDKHGGEVWKVVLTDYANCPIVAGHWYQVKIVWNSAKVGGIPCDIYVDDQGTDGNGAGEKWSGFVNATKSDQAYLPEGRKLFEGDVIKKADGYLALGVNVNDQANNVFKGFIDWIRWVAEVE
ncbi:MAG: hypothetical protein AB1486_29055 [Planctomycetota bacterium]